MSMNKFIRQHAQRIRPFLANKSRELLFFDLVTLSGLSMDQILHLKVKNLQDVRMGSSLLVSDGEVAVPVHVKEVILRSFDRMIEEVKLGKDDYVFKSRKGSLPITPSTVSHMKRRWLELVGLENSKEFLAPPGPKARFDYLPMTDRQAEPIPRSPHPYIFKAIKPNTIHQTVLNELQEAIFSGKIAPGEEITVDQFATQLNVSRMPVRDAFNKLQARGLITIHKKRGSVVTKLSKENLKEIVEIRLQLEKIAAQEAASKCSENTLEKLSDILKNLEQANLRGDVDEALRLNKEFHFSIYHEAKRPMLEELIEIVWSRLSPYLHILLRMQNFDWIFDAEVHRQILEAIRKKDPAGTCKYLHLDLSQTKELISQWNFSESTTQH